MGNRELRIRNEGVAPPRFSVISSPFPILSFITPLRLTVRRTPHPTQNGEQRTQNSERGYGSPPRFYVISSPFRIPHFITNSQLASCPFSRRPPANRNDPAKFTALLVCGLYARLGQEFSHAEHLQPHLRFVELLQHYSKLMDKVARTLCPSSLSIVRRC